MFNKEEDYYFLTYNTLLILNELECVSREKSFWDYRKLIYLIQFISDTSKLNIIINKKILNEEDIHILQEIYINSTLKMKLYRTILFALENQGFIHLDRNSKRNSIDVWLDTSRISTKFLNLELFDIEIKNVRELKKQIAKIRTIKSGTLLNKIFTEKGVIAWDV